MADSNATRNLLMNPDVETLIIGAGVIGLAIGRTLAERGHDIMVLERNDRIGAETSSRNSEVIHAGIYYPPGSLRAKLCVAGKEALYRFADDNDVSYRRYGKLLTATTMNECKLLNAIAVNAMQNGVGDLKPLSAGDVRNLEPELNCVAALLSPSTGVIDSHALMLALEGHLTSAGGMIVLNTEVSNLQRLSIGGSPGFEITTMDGNDITCRNLIIAAGLGAEVVTKTLDTAPHAYCPPILHPAKGHYFTLTGKCPFSHLVYPIPTAAWLGVHLTLDITGRSKFGPDLEWTNDLSYAFDDPDGARKKAFEESIRKFWPALPDNALVPDYTGIRPKIYGPGETVADFAIHGRDAHGQNNLIALYGIESPGLTSSLAIADYVANMLQQTVND